MNLIVLTGRLTRDPELRYLPSGNNTAYARFTLAVDKNLSREKRQAMESKNEPTADFINVVVWGKLAEVCTNWTKKGMKVGVQGRVQTGSYEDKQGNRRYTVEVVASSIEFLDSKSEKAPDYSDVDLGGYYQIDNEDIPF